MSAVLTFLSNWGWLVGLIGLAIVVAWPDIAPHVSKHLHVDEGINQSLRTVDFYPTRQFSGIDLPGLLADKKVDIFWIMTPAATKFTSENCYKLKNAANKRKVARLMLLSPSGNTFEAFAMVEPDRTKAKLASEIHGSVETLRGAGLLSEISHADFKLKFLDAPFNPTIIANPEHGDYGWIQIELYYPCSESENRPLLRIWKHEHPERFKEIVAAYEKAWKDFATDGN